MIEKYVGKVVEIVYLDRYNKFTQRKIEVWAIHGNIVKALCLEQRAPRTFRVDNILAVQPVVSRVI